MRFELRNLTANANLALLDASGRAVTIGTVRTGTGVDSIVRWLRAGTYYVRVNAVAAGTIGYALRYHNEDGRTRARAIQLGNLTNLAAARVTPRGTVNRSATPRTTTASHWPTRARCASSCAASVRMRTCSWRTRPGGNLAHRATPAPPSIRWCTRSMPGPTTSASMQSKAAPSATSSATVTTTGPRPAPPPISATWPMWWRRAPVRAR